MATLDDIYGGTVTMPIKAEHMESPGEQPWKAPKIDNSSLVGRETDENGRVVAQKPMTYVDMFNMYNPDKPETAEERAKREKREKSEAALAAVGDSISALSNLWFTSQYSPNAYDSSKGLSATTKERWDKLRQEREANRRAWYDGYVRARSMDEAKDREDRSWRHTLKREKIADDRYEAQAKLEEKKAKLDEQLRLHQITAAEYKAEQERISALYADDTEKLKQDNLRAGIKQKNAAATASYAAAVASNAKAESIKSGGGGGKSGPTLQLEDDEPMRFGDDKDYDRTVMRLAPDYGVPTTVVVVTEKDHNGNPRKQQTVKRDVKDIAADIEREAAKRKKTNQQNNTMPGVGGNGRSTNTMPGVK